MNERYQQALAAMPVEDVSFILSQLPAQDVSSHTVTANAENPTLISDEDEESRRRRRIDREWPEVGAILTAEYFGEEYRAEVIPAAKKLKSGRQIRLDSGPCKGVICDSLSEAMIQATEMQRTSQALGRRGVSNGWLFWQWDGKPSNINGEDQEDDRE